MEMVPSEENQLVPKEGMLWSCRQSIFEEMKKKFAQIENAAEEPRVLCIIQDTTNAKTVNERLTLNLPASTSLAKLFEDVAHKAGYVNGTFDLTWGNMADMAPLDHGSEMSLTESGFEAGKKNFLQLTDKDGEQPQIASDESGTADSSGLDDSSQDRFIGPLPRDGTTGCSSDYSSPSYSYSSILNKSETGYVGLVNQAMTCYLNSLLQTLFMTPEFRNALYNWEFEESEEDPVTSIPYQLQRLFVLLQTSKKRAIETTDVTRSFGWDSSEAWQQHDVQELCRVMFDALEQKWKQTEQADLINQLYQGKLKDYVRCLECSYESWRIDTYLDIPLVIRPFGSTQAFGSVEEALQAFIQPETLDGPNQYFCERCKKKCDARKGLRFLHFPYLLTLQLKRFDFDYTTMHRIKLNDRMTFPEELDMSPFIDVEDESPQTESCTDSGAENEGSCHSDQMSNDFSTDDGVDEGICLDNTSSTERTLKPKSSLTFELFSVMVHSGSAAGGHYYACIKSFSDGQWYSFNDQHVSKITQDDIRKTYGGSSGTRGYYSSAFASSTNAYMLIYRLKDPSRNAKYLDVEDFPEHIKRLVQKEKESEEQEKRQREIERNTCKIKLFCMHPVKMMMVENKLEVHKDKTLKEAVEIAYKLMDLEALVPLDCCRLVKYDEFHEYLERSYEGEEDTPMGLLLGGVKSSYMFDLLLETRRPDQVFQPYKPGEVMVKVHVVALKSETIAPPVSVRAYLNQTVTEFKQLIAQATGLSAETMRVVLERCYNDLRLLYVPNKTLKAEGFFRSNKVFVESSDSTDHQVTFTDSLLWKLLDRHGNTIRLFVSLPEQAPGSLAGRTLCQKAGGEPGEAFEGPKGSRKSVEAILEESTEKLKNLSLQQQEEQQGSSASDSQKSSDASDFEHIESPSQEADSAPSVSAADNRDLENRIRAASGSGGGGGTSDPENPFPSEERSDSDVNNDRSTSSVDSDILSSSHSSDTLCNADSGPLPLAGGLCGADGAPLPLANGLDSHSITSSRRSKAHEGKKETWDTAEEDSGTDSEYDENGKSKAEAQYLYFRAEPCSLEDGSAEGQKCLLVHVDKRITLAAFKQNLEPFVGVSSSQFKVFRVYANNQEFESVRLNETLSSFSDDNKITIRLGRALKKGEYRVKVYQLLVNDPEPCKFLVDSVFAKGMTVRQSKEELLPQLRDQCKLDLSIERFRLRKKTWKNPGTVFLDYHVYEEDINISSNWEVFLEVLDEPEKMKSMSQLAILTRRWRPAHMKLEPFQEVVLESSSVDELKEKLSEISGIPLENLEFAKGRGTFPCDISVLEIHQDLDWNPKVSTLNVWPLYICDDGAVVFYRDKTEEPMELSEEERTELMKKESSRLLKTGHRVSYSPRKEKALKIYLDGGPTKDPGQD
ncbi:ubiquitin carboxyl-terminal hydrolase 47 isoform X2 [Megalops cyprinoides]|uniref:ubiquitin carboxyl-terminal hydrolase 47 isoform X2 n=1 Tax=Megalops cyprinoides TaxID=118141 RepID=UPI0018656995|nr:ubiquitin carboxyl-terminal hydrolase 47 isoform X2 [Megalops cyprinoides]